MSDLISRSRLIEEIKENQWGWFSREMLLLMLENQPSVTDTNVDCKWIPCSEKLPKIEEAPTVYAVPLKDVYRIIAGHSDYHGDSILSALQCIAEGKEVKPIKPIEV